MDLILLEKVQNLGDLGDTVSVKPGFGRNYLLPQGKAVPATKENVEQFEAKRAELEKVAQSKLSESEQRAASLADLTVTITANATEEGNLYGSIGPREISNALEAEGHQVEKSEVIMGEGPIGVVGEYDVHLQLHADVEQHIKLIIEAE
ncbi:MAG TPA: 50S ribosomal protein L9 [Xanthomonadales bacterium]|nr:50S ribosomal protein L9 [Xanthomonadales bacterium]